MSSAATTRSLRPTRPTLLLWGAALAAVLAVAAVALLAPTRADAQLDPQNPHRSGAQALTRILGAQGVDVTVVRGLPALKEAGPGRDSTLVIGASDQLTPAALDAALQEAGSADRVVVLAPSDTAAERLGLLAQEARETDAVGGGCADAGLRGDLSITGGGLRYAGGGADAVRCFRGEGPAGYLVRQSAFEGRPEVWTLGSAAALSNAHLAEQDNAALALAVLGHSSRVVWYQAQAADTPAGADGERGLDEIVPRWVGYVLVLLFSAVLVTMLWRGRRFGRLVHEPLPVLVRAGEITEARARLYRRAKDAPRAALALQSGTRRRLAERFGLPSSSSPEQLLPEISAATGRPVAELFPALYSDVPARDEELMALAQHLLTIEEEVKGS